MRSLGLLSVAVAVVSFVSCAGDGRAPVEACARVPAPLPGPAPRASSEPFLGMLMLLDTGVILARLDPRSLKPVSPQVDVGEYHDA